MSHSILDYLALVIDVGFQNKELGKSKKSLGMNFPPTILKAHIILCPPKQQKLNWKTYMSPCKCITNLLDLVLIKVLVVIFHTSVDLTKCTKMTWFGPTTCSTCIVQQK